MRPGQAPHPQPKCRETWQSLNASAAIGESRAPRRLHENWRGLWLTVHPEVPKPSVGSGSTPAATLLVAKDGHS